jgi:hypothetical protein
MHPGPETLADVSPAALRRALDARRALADRPPREGIVWEGAWVRYEGAAARIRGALSGHPWSMPGYDPAEAGRLARALRAGTAGPVDLRGIRAVLTWCHRGERFAEGHWGGLPGRRHGRGGPRRPRPAGRGRGLSGVPLPPLAGPPGGCHHPPG